MTRKIGLQCRFAVAMGLALTVVAVVLAGMWWQLRANHSAFVLLSQQSIHDGSMKGLERYGREMTKQAAAQLVNPLYYYDLGKIGDTLATLKRQPDVAYARVVDGQARLIHDGSEEIAGFGLTVAASLAASASGESGPIGPIDARLLEFSEPIRLDEQVLGKMVIGLSLGSTQARERAAAIALQQRLDIAADRHLAILFGLLAVLLVLGLALLLLVARGLVQPIRTLADAARRIESGDLDATLPDSTRSDEIGELIRAFSRMSVGVAGHQRELRRAAYRDSLTGLPNRHAFRESLDQRLQAQQFRGGELALLFLDLDEFKQVNDSLGHDAGDLILNEFAARMRTQVSQLAGPNALLARFGGDEFVVLIEGAEVAVRAAELAQALLDALRRPFPLGDRQIVLGASIGITLYPRDAQQAGMLLKHGDIAMYQAKQDGKNHFRYFSTGMDIQVDRRARMEQDLRGAWERGELELVYQPIFRMSDRRLVGVEALLRWQHPEHGPISPTVFIPVAEQCGLIEELGARVLRRGCHDVGQWRQCDGAGLSLAINVSSRQLRQGLLLRQVDSALAESGLEPSRLHLELTETAVLTELAQASVVLCHLRQSGVQIWLDDFGTGFSGLNHLRQMPIDGVKIDRSFIADVLSDPDDLALASGIISMAHGRGISVIAEGIEREDQFDLLRRHGCDHAQGFWLGRPMTARAFGRHYMTSRVELEP